MWNEAFENAFGMQTPIQAGNLSWMLVYDCLKQGEVKLIFDVNQERLLDFNKFYMEYSTYFDQNNAFRYNKCPTTWICL